MKNIRLILAVLLVAALGTTTFAQEGKTLKRKVAIGRFTNETQYGKGIFYDRENDPMRKHPFIEISRQRQVHPLGT